MSSKITTNLAYSIFQQGAGMIDAYDAAYGTAAGCANRGLVGLNWGGSYVEGGAYLWNDAYLWNSAYLWNNGLIEPMAINVWVPQE